MYSANTVSFSQRRQRGAALVVSLILLLVLTLVVLSTNQDVLIQEKMTSAIRESNTVFQLVESTIAQAQVAVGNYVLSDFTQDGKGTTTGLYSLGNGPEDFLATSTWAAANTQSIAANAGYKAQYFVEDMGDYVPPESSISKTQQNEYGQPQLSVNLRVYRIVARAYEEGSGTSRIVSVFYADTK